MSKQNMFENIKSASIKRVRENIVAGALDEFQQRLKILPTEIKELNADPYMFIFDTLLTNKDSVDYVFNIYEKMIDQNFLNPEKNSDLLAQHFRKHLDQHSYKIIQILMKIRNPNPTFFGVFFDIHNTIPMAENILMNFRKVGFSWLSRAFAFKRYPKPTFMNEIIGNVLKLEDQSLPSLEDEEFAIKKYVQKILVNVVLEVEDDIDYKEDPRKKKYGFCFMCRQPAGFYCKDTKIPVCSSDCKKAHINYVSNNTCLDYQYTQQFREQIEQLLFSNIRTKKNVALSVDFLCYICIHSDYIPKCQFPHYELLNSPIIEERIWLLYFLYHYRKNLMFEHIFVDALTCNKPNIRQVAQHYFVKITENDRIMEIYKNYDFSNQKKLIPTLIKNFDKQSKVRIIYSLINYAYKNSNGNKQIVQNYDNKETRLLRAFNHEKEPIHTFSLIFGQEKWLQNYINFAIKNQANINKSKFAEFIMKNDDYCRKFLQVLIQPIKKAPVDEIIRQIFYFLNTKISDKVYRLIELLCQVYSPPDIFNSSQNTFFQFSYFVIMVVTELNKPEMSKNMNLKAFLERVKHFDTKLVENHQNYLKQVYDRLSSEPFSQETRGILSYYYDVPAQEQIKGFSPVFSILQNWENFYDILTENQNDTTVLYRCCTLLASSPIYCQPFLQLLINKIDATSIRDEEHLVPSISSIIQEQPNAVGSSWRNIFYIKQSTLSYVFELGTLIHCSQELLDGNFVSFVRQFISGTRLIPPFELFNPCLKLMSFNSHRIDLVQRQIRQLFTSEYNVYHQLQFLTGIFNLQLYDIGTILMADPEINHISGIFITETLTKIIKKHYKSLPEKTYQTMIKIMLRVVSKQLQEAFSQCLKAIPQCYKYFEEFNIERATLIPFDGSTQIINPDLVKKLNKLQAQIPKMKHKTLKQFIFPENKTTIIENFVYFCEIAQVYEFLSSEKCLDSEYESIFFVVQSKIFESNLVKIASFPVFLVSALLNIESEQLRQNYEMVLQKLINYNIQESTGEEFIRKAEITLSFLVACLMKEKSFEGKNLSFVFLLQEVYIWAKAFNDDLPKRMALWKEGPFKKLKEPPCLFQHENLAIIIKFLLRKNQVNDEKTCEKVFQQLLNYFQDIISDFRRVLDEYSDSQRKKNKVSEISELNRKIGKIIESFPTFIKIIKEFLKGNGKTQQIKKINSKLAELLESGFMNYNSKNGEILKSAQKINPILELFKQLNEK